jgi:UDP-N-acetylmuramate dehydrogenase
VSWKDNLPPVRGKLLFDEPLAPFTWLRVGGPAEVLFLPEDVDDLAGFLKALPADVPVYPIGVGSNLLVRDGGVDGVVIRLAGKGFNQIQPRSGSSILAGAAVPDAILAREAGKAGIAGLEFFRGVPGTVGGACMMNAGCYGSETKDVLAIAYGVNRAGGRFALHNEQMGFSYRRAAAAAGGDLIFTSALFRGVPGVPKTIAERMEEITARRETTQPIREKTGGSTFKNPAEISAWKAIDEAGWRGKPFGGAMFSPLHANFLINTGEATAADIEGLGEAVRADVLAKAGVQLEWEIKRIGRPA